jgi:hypothetical protein
MRGAICASRISFLHRSANTSSIDHARIRILWHFGWLSLAKNIIVNNFHHSLSGYSIATRDTWQKHHSLLTNWPDFK